MSKGVPRVGWETPGDRHVWAGMTEGMRQVGRRWDSCRGQLPSSLEVSITTQAGSCLLTVVLRLCTQTYPHRQIEKNGLCTSKLNILLNPSVLVYVMET